MKINLNLVYSFLIFLGIMGVSSYTNAQNKSGYRNLFSISPLGTYSILSYGSDYSFAISYERIIDKNGNIGVLIPFSFGLSISKKDFQGDLFNSVLKLNPGVTFYPWGQRRLTAGLGLSVCYMHGNYTSNYLRWDNRTQFWQLGILANQSLRFELNKQILIGFNIGLGPNFIEATQNEDLFWNKTSGKLRHTALFLTYKF